MIDPGLGSSYLDTLNLKVTQLEGKLDVHKVILDNLNQNLIDMKQGMAARIEQDGKDIAILKEASKVFVCQKDFSPIKEAVKELKDDRRLVFSMIMSGIAHVWEILMITVFKR